MTTAKPCRGCGKPAISRTAYNRTPALRERFVRFAGHGMCAACYKLAYRRGTLPDPAPPVPEPRTAAGGNCHGCGTTTDPAPRKQPARVLAPQTLARLRAAVGVTVPGAESHTRAEVTP
jgi:hypothetical protein